MCDCGSKTGCIYNDTALYDKIYLRTYNKHVINEDDNNLYHDDVNGCEVIARRLPAIETIRQGAKCVLLFRMMLLEISLKMTHKNNIENKKVVYKRDKLVERIINKTKNSHRLIADAKRENDILSEALMKARDKEARYKQANKQLKRDNKRLIYILAQTDIEGDDIEPVKAIESNTGETTDDSASDTTEILHDDVLLKYERIKDFMNRQGMPLNVLLKDGFDRYELIDKYVKLKYDRIQIAHPEICEPIADINEFADVLMSC